MTSETRHAVWEYAGERVRAQRGRRFKERGGDG